MRNPGLWFVGIILFLALLVGGLYWSSYNKLVNSNESIDSSWAQVENVLQRRFNLIPNLVETVKGYAKHERGLFTEVTRLRSQWGAARNTGEKVAAARGMEGVISRLLLVAENYPVLKASQNFSRLQDELAGTENRIAVERMRYNEAVRLYNVTVKRFPSNIVASIHEFEKRDVYFKVEKKEAREVPKVRF